jgi:multidrug resistance efflux pump
MKYEVATVSDQPRRIPGLGAVIAIAFLIVPIVAVAWWLTRPKGESVSIASQGELDVVCLGRVDGLIPVANLEPAIPGRVDELFVAEGQTVKAKQKLLKLDDESLKLRVDEANQAIAAAKIELESAQIEQAIYPGRKMSQEAAVAAAVERVELARKLFQEKEKAKSFGTVTAAELIAAEAEITQSMHLVDLEKNRLAELEKMKPGLKIQAAETKRAMAEISLKQAEKAIRDCILLAPSDGVILRVQTSVGETVVPGGMQSAIVFRPGGDLIIRAELEQEFLGRVKPGMKAIVRDDVRADSPIWNGTVLRLGSWVARKRAILLDPGELNDVRTVECIIVLDGKPEGLLIGQRMRVRIGKGE